MAVRDLKRIVERSDTPARPIETRHVISVTTGGDGRPLHRVPAQVDLATLSPVEAVTVDGVPLVSAGPEPLSTWRRVRPGKQRAFAFAGPRSLGGQAVGDVVIRKLASLPRMDMRSPIVGDIPGRRRRVPRDPRGRDVRPIVFGRADRFFKRSGRGPARRARPSAHRLRSG